MRLRFVLTGVVLLCIARNTYGMNIRATTRADHKSLDLVVRRLENGAPEDIAASLQHLRPMLTRYGGPIGWGAIEVGSPEEADLICAHHGYANTSVNRDEVMRDVRIGIWRWLRNQLVAIALGMGPMLPVVVGLYLLYRYRGKVIKAFDSAVEDAVPNKEARKMLFADPLIKKEHAKLKKTSSASPASPVLPA